MELVCVRTLASRPVRETVLGDREAREHVGSLLLELSRPWASRAGCSARTFPTRPCGGVQAAEGLAVEAVRPQAVLLARGPDCLRALAPRFGPPVLARPVEHRLRHEHRAGSTPHDLDRLVVDVLAHAHEEPVGELGPRLEPPQGEERAGFAQEQCRRRGRWHVVPLRVVRGLLPEVERSSRRRREIDLRLTETATSKSAERPDHARRSDVEVFQRMRSLPSVPFLDGPEPVGIEVGVGVHDDPTDRVACPLVVPGLVGQRLVELSTGRAWPNHRACLE